MKAVMAALRVVIFEQDAAGTRCEAFAQAP